MNIILIHEQEWLSETESFHVCLTDRRATHILNTLKPEPGQSIRVGKVNGSVGRASVVRVSSQKVTISIDPANKSTPPVPAKTQLIVALPRPKTARRIVRTATELGIKTLHFINSYKVEKSYWQSPLLSSEALNQQVWMGLEQSKDTQLPSIHLHKRFKPFIEDDFPGLIEHDPAFLAHPDNSLPTASLAKTDLNRSHWFIVGPEGGFSDYEVSRIMEAGCKSINFGQRVLRTETFVPFLMGHLSALNSSHTTVV